MKNKKLLSLLLCATLAASMLIGCGGKEDTDTTTADVETTTEVEDTTEEVTEEVTEEASALTGEIHYAYWQENLGTYLEECKANFEAANPGVTIVLEPTAWGEYWTKLETAATGGTAADVFQMNGPNIYKYSDAGIILPLDDYIANSSIEMDKFPAAMVEMHSVDGVQYSIPMDWDTIGLWYNKELFDAAGVAYPTDDWTWDDLVAAAAAITDEANGVYGFASGYKDQGGFFNTVPAAGGYIISEDGKSCGFDDEATIKGIQLWVDMMEYSPSQASLTETADYIQFMSGKIGMLMAGDWYAGTFVTDPEFAAKIDVALLPLIDGNRATCIHGKGNCILASTEYPETAWAWVEYLASAEANEILGKTGVAIPAHLDYSDLFFEAYPDYNMGIFSQEAAECAVPYPTSRGWSEWADVVWNELVPVFSFEKTLDEACANITTQMNEILAAYN